MKELVVISGKGGTGKTSLTASLAVLAGHSVIADCDVDAADLHLVLRPDIRSRHEFWSGHEAIIRPDACNGCGRCAADCRFDAIAPNPAADGGAPLIVDPILCEGCGVCVHFCPAAAIDFPERLAGEWMVSDTRCGPMVHARLGVASENSGKLVSTVRREARQLAERTGEGLILVDGPPGIGCPVIASVTGASLLLAVTEPTVSGVHDLDRVMALASHFRVPVAVCVNKWDLNPDMTVQIEASVARHGAMVAGRVRYDRGVTQAQLHEQAVVETTTPCAADVVALWDTLRAHPALT